VHYLNSLDALNTSNQRVRDLITGRCKKGIPDTGTFIWVDVRDVALAHARAMELPEAADKRFFVTAGYFSNKEIADIVRKHFPEYGDRLPSPETKGGDYPEAGLYKYDNSRVIKILGLKFRSLEGRIVDLVKSLKSVGA
jgi:nucleoside-diphosphate-sugar epimerase